MARVARRRTTIDDIATAADASASTVSLVLNGSWARHRIAEDTARRVTEAARRLGYNPNLAARGLPDRLCHGAGVPCVNLDLPGVDAPSVASDDRGGARRPTEAMLARALERGGTAEDLLHLGGVAGEHANDNRVAGFGDALRARGVEPGPGHPDLRGDPPESCRDALRSRVERRGGLPPGLFLNSIAAFEGAAEYAADLPAAGRGALLACRFDVAMLRQDVGAMTRHAFEALEPAPQEARALTLVPAVSAEARGRRPRARSARIAPSPAGSETAS